LYRGDELREGESRTIEGAIEAAWAQFDADTRSNFELYVREIWVRGSNPINDVRVVLGKKPDEPR
jgi:hypothetical protein